MLCKHPEETCGIMTFYQGKIYCDNQNGFCYLHDELPPYTNADRIRDMRNDELSVFLWQFNLEEVAREDVSFITRRKLLEWLISPVKEESDSYD